MLDILIIGGGPAGLTAGLYAARAGRNALVVETSIAGGQAVTTNLIENYPGFAEGIGGPELIMAMLEQCERAGVSIEYAAIDALELTHGDVKRARMGDRWLEAKAILLCMGAKPRRLYAEGEERLLGRGIGFCATCDGAFYRGKRVAVIGGGNTAAEEALYLAALAAEVTLIHRRDALRADDVLAKRLTQTPTLRFRWQTEVEAFEGVDKLTSMRLRNTKTGQTDSLPIDGAFLAIGRVPNTELVKDQVSLDAHGFILAGEDTHTNLPGVFAAGDIRQKPLRQVITAAADGATAVYEALRYLDEMESLKI